MVIHNHKKNIPLRITVIGNQKKILSHKTVTSNQRKKFSHMQRLPVTKKKIILLIMFIGNENQSNLSTDSYAATSGHIDNNR